MRRTVLAASDVLLETLHAGGHRFRAIGVTLTYANTDGWAPGQLTRYVEAVKAYCKRRRWELGYVTRFEFGAQNGRPHYHVLFLLPDRPGVVLPRSDVRGWWPHGLTRSQRIKGLETAAYIAKATYLGKAAETAQRWDLKGARWVSYGGLRAAQRQAVRWRCVPQWVRDFRDRIDGDSGILLRKVGSRWRVGPWLLRSPWRCLETAGGFLQFHWRGFDAESVVFAH